MSEEKFWKKIFENPKETLEKISPTKEDDAKIKQAIKEISDNLHHQYKLKNGKK